MQCAPYGVRVKYVACRNRQFGYGLPTGGGLFFIGLLLFLSSFSLASDDKPASCPLSLGAVGRTKEQRTAYEQLHKGFIWKKFKEGEMDYRRFISKKSYDEKAKGQPPSSIYGTKNYLAWRKAADYLENIPQGKLELSLDLFSKVHELSASELFPVLSATRWIIPSGLIPNTPGAYKRRPSLGKDPLFEPLTEKQYHAILKNPWLAKGGFQELPVGSQPNARRGIIRYATASETKPKLEKLIQWYNENKTTMDPVELAARFQQAFVSIHPFIDGNGRTSRLLMDRILAEHGLPPALLTSQSDDIYLTPEEYTLRVREGIDEFLKLESSRFHGEIIPSVNRTSGSEIVGLGFRPSGDGKTMAKHHKYMSINDWGNPEISLGGRPFTFTQDGFIYSPKGIPHVYHEGTLYPITDKSYHLYVARNDKLGRSGKLTDSQRDIYRRHFGLFRNIDNGKIDPFKIKIAPYSSIEKANKLNQHQLYEWQKPAFLEAVTIKAKEPIDVLISNELPKTNFELSAGANAQPMEILAQYEFRDLEFWKHLEYAKHHYPEAVPAIWESRAKLWEAGRALLKEYLKDLEGVKHDLPNMRKSATFHLWESFFNSSKLSYDTFDKAVRLTDDRKITVVRSDTSSASLVGFRSQGDYQRLFESLPGFERLRAYSGSIRAYIADPKNADALKKQKEAWQQRLKKYAALTPLLPGELRKFATDFEKTFDQFMILHHNLHEKTLGDKYSTRGASAEFDRAEIDYVLHAHGTTPSKEGTSFTTHLGLLLPGGLNTEHLTFATYSNDSRLFLVRAPKRKVEFNHLTYISEYEILGMKPIYPWSIEKSYRAADLSSGRPDGLSESANAFLTKYNLGAAKSQSVAKEMKKLKMIEIENSQKYSNAMKDPKATEEDTKKAYADFLKVQQEIQEKKAKLLNTTELPLTPSTAPDRL